MYIGSVPSRVESRPLRQCRFGYSNSKDISFFFACTLQDACHSIIPIKTFRIQPDCLTDFGIQSVNRQERFADSDFIRQFWEPPLYQFHLAAGNIHHVAVAVHIGGIVSLPGMLLTQQIVFAHAGKIWQLFQSRNLGFIHATQNRFIGISHLITLDLYNRDRYYRCKADKECRQSDSNHHHQVPALLAGEAPLCQLLHNGAGVVLKGPSHTLPPN